MDPEVVRVGSGRRLLLLHSGFCTWVEFRRLIDLLATDHEVIAPTLPGSVGGPRLDVRASMLAEHARYVETVLDDAGWQEPVDTVGSSIGGVLALELLARGRAHSTIALAPPWTTGAGLAFYGALFASLPALGLSRPLWPRTTRSGTINGLWFHQSRTPPLIDPADVALLLESWSRFPFYRVGLHARRRGPGMPDFSRIDQGRATLVWGGRDLIVPKWMRRRWSAALPGSHEVTLPGFPHQPHLRDPRVIADIIRGRV
jgi:pimeloyl-ACP methyl ester carboxylesterase